MRSHDIALLQDDIDPVSPPYWLPWRPEWGAGGVVSLERVPESCISGGELGQPLALLLLPQQQTEEDGSLVGV